MTLHGLLRRAAAVDGGRPVLITPDGVTSYAGLLDRASRVAGALRDHGVRAGDRVIIALENSPDMVAVYFGTLMAGAIAVPLPPGPRSDRVGHAVADCTPACAVVDRATVDGLGDEVFRPVPTLVVAGEAPAGRAVALASWFAHAPGGSGHEADTALAAIIYTSGSTGQPRGVMLSHRNFVANARSIVEYLRLTAADRVMCVLPFNYVYGLSLLHTHVLAGGSLVLENRAAFPNVVLEAMATHAVTGFAGVPSTFALMLHRSNLDGVPLPHLRYVTQAGGAMAPARITEWVRRVPGPAFFVMYGATEAAARLTYLPPGDLPRKLGSVGRPIPGVEIRVRLDDGRPAAAGEIGELVARGENIAAGYWGRPEDTAERFGPDGYRTGDLGYADAEGFLFLTGRQHDMIKVGANRVGAREIEDVLLTHAAVHEAAVVAVPHDLLGEVPVAVVSLRTPIDEAETELRRHCAGVLAPYKVPAKVLVLPDLPKLATAGKLDRLALRAVALAAAGAAAG